MVGSMFVAQKLGNRSQNLHVKRCVHHTSACVHYTNFAYSELYIKCRDDVQVTRSTTCSEDGQWEDLSLPCYCECKFDDIPGSVTLSNLDTQGYLGHNKTLEWKYKKALQKMS